MKSICLNGINVYPFESRHQLLHHIDNIDSGILIAVNTEKLMNANDDVKQLISKNIGYADGYGVVWAFKKNKIKNTIKIPGCELWLDIITHNHENKTFYFVGAKESVIQETIAKLQNEFPQIKILGYRNGYIKNQDEENDLLNDIETKKPDFVFVAMGSPKQEILMQKMQKVNPAIYQGLGGSFDLYTGIAKPVPDWWKKVFKWEGLYRSFNNFTNIKRWKRQLVVFKFLNKILFTNFK